jgi:hypothetical protein
MGKDETGNQTGHLKLHHFLHTFIKFIRGV